MNDDSSANESINVCEPRRASWANESRAGVLVMLGERRRLGQARADARVSSRHASAVQWRRWRTRRADMVFLVNFF